MTLFEHLPHQVKVYEVGPRDGLQNESVVVPTSTKIEFIDRLAAAGLPVIEATSFVRGAMIPQLADAEDVMRGMRRAVGTRYAALVPNLKGMERATETKPDMVALFTAASETFSRKNTNATIAESLERFRPVVSVARLTGVEIRGYVSTAFGCPYEGEIAVSSVVRVAADLLALGADEIVLSDTIGVATPSHVERVVASVAERVPLERLALHFHDTRGCALTNVLTGLLLGVTTFDASAGGLGGCPYAPGATGNLATEDLVYLLQNLGIETGVDLGLVIEASRFLAEATGNAPVSRVYQALK